MKYIAAFIVIHFFFILTMYNLNEKKLSFKEKKLYSTYFVSLFLLLITFEYSLPAFRVIFNYFIYSFVSWLLIDKEIKKSLITGLFVMLISIFCELFYAILIGQILNQTLFIEESSYMVLINNFLIGLFMVLFSRFKRVQQLYDKVLKVTIKIGEKEIAIFLLLAVVIFNSFSWLFYFISQEFINSYFLIFIGSFFCLISSVLIFIYLKTNNKYLLMHERYNISLESIREFELIIENYRINTHENRNQFRTIRNISKNKKVMNYIDALLNEKITDDEKLLMSVQRIPSGGLRGIIYSKLLLMKEKNIIFELNVDRKIKSENIGKIDDYTLTDICRILGVLLDNAIEGVLNLNDKNIMVELYEDDDDIVIAITNNYEGYVDIEYINNPKISTKGENHGYGLSLMKKLVRKNKKIQHSSEFFEDNFMQKIRIKV